MDQQTSHELFLCPSLEAAAQMPELAAELQVTYSQRLPRPSASTSTCGAGPQYILDLQFRSPYIDCTLRHDAKLLEASCVQRHRIRLTRSDRRLRNVIEPAIAPLKLRTNTKGV